MAWKMAKHLLEKHFNFFQSRHQVLSVCETLSRICVFLRDPCCRLCVHYSRIKWTLINILVTRYTHCPGAAKLIRVVNFISYEQNIETGQKPWDDYQICMLHWTYFAQSTLCFACFLSKFLWRKSNLLKFSGQRH
jgi:hypothetical protein